MSDYPETELAIEVFWYGKRTVVMRRLSDPADWPEEQRPFFGYVLGPEHTARCYPSGEVMYTTLWSLSLTQYFRKDATCFWNASVDYPTEMDPGDGCSHSVSEHGDTAQESLDRLRDQLAGVRAWLDKTTAPVVPEGPCRA